MKTRSPAPTTPRMEPSKAIGTRLCQLAAAMAAVSSYGLAQAQTWTKIADEGQAFTVSGTQTVRYGANASWIQRATTSGNCLIETKDDPPLLGLILF